MTGRNRRVSVTLSPSQHAELFHRARAHGVTLAAYLRQAGLGRAPDAPARSEAAAADAWWATRDAKARVSYFRWLSDRPTDAAPPSPDQLVFSWEDPDEH